MQTVTPFLWFDNQAEEAAHFYVSLVAGSRITAVRRAGTGGVMAVTFELAGRPHIAMNGGPHFHFTPAISLFVECDDQDEVDALWDGLSAGGQPQRCGWLQDRYGLSWQVVPRALGALLQGPDADRSARVMRAMTGMIKLDIATLERAAYGEERS